MKLTKKILIPILLTITLPFFGGCSSSQSSETTYTITFNSNGGSLVSSQNVKKGEKATRPSDPIKEGYAFVNWFKDESLTNFFDFSTPIEYNMVLYAKWHNTSFNSGLFIGDTEITKNGEQFDNKYGKITYENSTNTLTLNSCNLLGSQTKYYSYNDDGNTYDYLLAYSGTRDLNIKLENDSNLIGEENHPYLISGIGIISDANVYITGNGKISFSLITREFIYMKKGLLKTDGITLSAENYSSYCGLNCNDIEFNNTTINFIGKSFDVCKIGISSYKFRITNSNVTVKNSFYIIGSDDLRINSSNLILDGATTTALRYFSCENSSLNCNFLKAGFVSYLGMKFIDSSVTINAGESYAVYCPTTTARFINCPKVFISCTSNYGYTLNGFIVIFDNCPDVKIESYAGVAINTVHPLGEDFENRGLNITKSNVVAIVKNPSLGRPSGAIMGDGACVLSECFLLNGQKILSKSVTIDESEVFVLYGICGKNDTELNVDTSMIPPYPINCVLEVNIVSN